MYIFRYVCMQTYRRVPLKPDFLGALKSVWLISNPAYQY